MRRPGLRQGLAVAVLALLAAALVVALLPVRNQVQDCGTPVAFLLAGRVNAATDESGVTRCSDLAGRRVGAAVGLTVGAAACAVGWAVLADRQARRVWQAWLREHETGPD